VLFKVVMEGGQKAFDLSEVVERRFVRLLMEIGVKGIRQIDGPSWDAQRPGDPTVDKKKARHSEESTRGVLETAYLRELLQGMGANNSSQTISLRAAKRRKSSRMRESRIRERWGAQIHQWESQWEGMKKTKRILQKGWME